MMKNGTPSPPPGNKEGNLHNLKSGKDCKTNKKAQATKEQKRTLDFIKIRNICASKHTVREATNPQNGGKYLHVVFLIRDWYPKYTKCSYNSMIKRQITQLENGQMT